MTKIPTDSRVRWVKASFSYASSNCVEIASMPDGIGMRDSKDVGGTVLRFPGSEWQAFIEGIKNGEFDRFGCV